MSAAQGRDHADGFMEFVNEARTPFHAVAECERRLQRAGYRRIEERDAWNLEKKGKYYFTRNGSTLVAFAIGGRFDPGGAGGGFTAIAAHTDSPCLKLKPKAESKAEGTRQLGVQTYGGLLLYPWFDRDLGLAGRVIVRGGEKKLEPRIVSIDQPVLKIPSLAIHLNRGVNQNGFKPSPQKELLPVYALDSASQESDSNKDSTASGIFSAIASRLGCEPDDIVDHELQLTDTQPAQRGGLRNEFVFSGRIDNLASCYQGLEALLNASDEQSLADDENVRCVVFFDNEEVGSRSMHGADGMVLPDFMKRVSQAFSNGTDGAFERAIRHSYIVSADCSHAVHPNYSDHHDPKHKPQLDQGPVIKIHCEQKYATSGPTGAIFRECCSLANVPYQDFVVRQDMGCGSTIGPITACKLGVPVVDVGIAQWAMHSIRETSGTADFDYHVRAYEKVLTEAPRIAKAFD